MGFIFIAFRKFWNANDDQVRLWCVRRRRVGNVEMANAQNPTPSTCVLASLHPLVATTCCDGTVPTPTLRTLLDTCHLLGTDIRQHLSIRPCKASTTKEEP